ncbi:MAG: murein transglycosylase A [Parahaliea sp.]
MTHADELKFSQLSGWQSDDMHEVWSSWQKSCHALRKKQQPKWINLCDQADKITPTRTNIRHYFERYFTLKLLTNTDGSSEGLITGYYEPVLRGSQQKNSVYKYPIYKKPTDSTLLKLSRKQIETHAEKFRDDVLLWTDNPYDLFFLHVQGSGQVELANGQRKALVYADNNGHEYTSIGKVLIKQGAIKKEALSLQTLKTWLNNNPAQATTILQQNQRYIFFDLIDIPEQQSGPRGSLNVALTPQRSIAIDPRYVPPGSPVFLQTTLPDDGTQARIFNRLVFAQDTGAAIKGKIRADVFFGQGAQAKFLAGNMNQQGKMYLLQPRY